MGILSQFKPYETHVALPNTPGVFVIGRYINKRENKMEFILPGIEKKDLRQRILSTINNKNSPFPEMSADLVFLIKAEDDETNATKIYNEVKKLCRYQPKN